LSLVACGVHVLGGVDRFQHRGDLAHLRSRYVAEDVAVEMHDASLPAGIGEELRRALSKTDAGIRDDQAHAFEATLLQVLQEPRPARLVLLGAFDDAEDLAIALGVDGYGNQQRDVPDLAGPRPLHHDAVEIDVGMLALDRTVPPGVDRRVDLLVEITNGGRRNPRAPQRLGDVLDPAHGNAGKIHLDQRFLDRRLATPVALYDRRLERLTPKLRHLQCHLAGLGLEAALVVAGTGITTGLGALVALRIAQPVRLGIEQRVQRLLDRTAHDAVQMSLDPLVIDPDHVAQRSRNRRILTRHGGFLLWLS